MAKVGVTNKAVKLNSVEANKCQINKKSNESIEVKPNRSEIMPSVLVALRSYEIYIITNTSART